MGLGNRVNKRLIVVSDGILTLKVLIIKTVKLDFEVQGPTLRVIPLPFFVFVFIFHVGVACQIKHLPSH